MGGEAPPNKESPGAPTGWRGGDVSEAMAWPVCLPLVDRIWPPAWVPTVCDLQVEVSVCGCLRPCRILPGGEWGPERRRGGTEEGERGEASRTGEGRQACQSEREMTGTKERVQGMVQETKRSGWAPGEEGAGGAACHAQSVLCAFEGLGAPGKSPLQRPVTEQPSTRRKPRC